MREYEFTDEQTARRILEESEISVETGSSANIRLFPINPSEDYPRSSCGKPSLLGILNGRAVYIFDGICSETAKYCDKIDERMKKPTAP